VVGDLAREWPSRKVSRAAVMEMKSGQQRGKRKMKTVEGAQVVVLPVGKTEIGVGIGVK